MAAKKDLPLCPVATTVSLIGSKWKLLILRAMERDGLLVRTVFPEVPPSVEYSLSELGESMRPIMLEMESWGKEYQTLFNNGQ